MGIAGVILGIFAILCALIATFLFGTVGGIIAGVLAVAAIVLGVLKKRKEGKGGTAAIILSVIAIILTLSLTSFWSGLFTEVHNKAVEYKPDGLWAQVTDDTSSGFFGLISKLPKDEASLQALADEMNELATFSDLSVAK